jgi:hypothetical protein
VAARAKVEKNNFTAGELSPVLRNRTDNERYQNGVKTLRNFVILPEGGITRRPGTKFIRAQKTESELGELIPFRYSGADSYMLILNGGKIRFARAGAIVLDAGNPYEVTMPWAAADLVNVRYAQEGNTAWLPCAGYQPRKLVRGSSHTDWTLSTYSPTGGPVKVQNLDTTKTIIASARTGAGISLIGVGTNFQAGHVGSVWRLDESDLALTANWKASEAITIPTEAVPTGGSNIGDFTNPGNAFDGNNATFANKSGSSGYLGKNQSPASAIVSTTILVTADKNAVIGLTLYGKVGGAPASETDGTPLGGTAGGVTTGDNTYTIYSSDVSTVWDYRWIRWFFISGEAPPIDVRIREMTALRFTASGLPVLRRYNGNVYQAIAGSNSGLTPPTHTDGDVLSETGGIVWRYRHNLGGFVRITAVADTTHATGDVVKTLPDSVVSRATYRWYEGAWNSIDGWPEGVLLIDRGLFFWRGREWWMTTVDNDNDFEVTTLDDSALASALRSRDGSLPSIQWALDNGVIVLGCRDNEIILRAPGTFDPLTIGTVRAPPGSRKGSAAHVPAALEGGAIFIGRNRKRLFYAAFDPDTQKLEPAEVSIAGKHLLKGKAAALGWQPDPLSVLWCCCQDGSLVGLTFNVEHKIAGMHSHPLTNGFVEAVKAIPSSDEGVSDVYMIVRRTINAATHRYIEMLGPYFEDAGAGDAAGAWFFDCALEYSGAAVSSITGLSHLEGQTVGILANKALHARKVVTGGAVTLDRSDVTAAVVGLPIDAKVVDLARNLNLQTGSTRNQKKRASHAVVEVVETIGGSIACNGGRAEALELTGTLNYGTAPKLYTGQKRKQMTGPLGDEAELELAASDGLPMTVIGLSPDLDVTED